MKIYLAGERAAMATTAAIRRLGGEQAAAVWTKGVRRRLFSFYYHGFDSKLYELDETTGLSTAIADALSFGWELFLDSGAFTAFTKGAEIGVDDYAAYIRKTQNTWTTCSSLDAIGRGDTDSPEQLASARESYRFFVQLKNRGAKVQPVYHVREPKKVLETYVKEGHDYIFIGGMVPESTPWLMQRLDDLWDSILINKDGTARVKIHGFGLTDSKLMFKYPWYSVDSSSWLMTGIFGACMFYRPELISMKKNPFQKVIFSDSESSAAARKLNAPVYRNMPELAQREVDTWLEPFQVTAEQLGQHYSFRDVVNASVFQSLEELGTDHFFNEQPTLTGWLLQQNYFDVPFTRIQYGEAA